MLPKLSVDQLISSPYLTFLNTLESGKFTGDIEHNYASRLAVSTDNSIYQNLPQGVIFPRNTQDVKIAIELANKQEYQSLTFSPRGGGTGTNGQSLNNGIIVDLSRHMNNILEINEQEGWVRVQTGVVKDQLNKFLKPYGYFFSPDLSTSNRATLGGMINTDASGQGSLVYGKTSDHVLELTSVIMSGDVLETSCEPTEIARAGGDSVQRSVTQKVADICYENRSLILEKFPRLNRFLTGYDLEHVFNNELTEFNLTRLLTGSEGSLAFITEAKLNLTPIPKLRTLVNIIYDSFDSALRDAPNLVKASATSVETVDSKVLGLAKQDIVWETVCDLIPERQDKITDGLNMVEYASNDANEQSRLLAILCERLDADINNERGGILGYQVCNELGEINRIYAMRKKSVGLLGATKGFTKPIAFAEDTAVPPEKLADFIVEFRALLDSHQLHYGMFGHVDAGVLHVRPAMDMCDEQQELRLVEISEQVVALTAKYGGLMWGEHGKGYRSEYGPEFFGEQLFEKLRVIKAIFDPNNRLNPGKICTPLHGEHALVKVSDIKRGTFDRQIPIAVREDFMPAMSCNGNGQCFNFDVDSPMCPSSKVTRDRRHSPKGRASMVREWLRLLSNQGVDPVALEKADCSASVLSKIKNSWLKARGDYDFSHEVMDTMKGCLACKACASQCPIKVDVPGFRSRFINLYHQRYLRPMSDHVVANVESMSALMEKFPKLSNALMTNSFSSFVLKKAVGMVDSPALSTPTLKQRIARRYHRFDLALLKSMTTLQRENIVLVVQDPFTSFYDAAVVEGVMVAIESLGFSPMLLPFKPNGKPAHVKGFLTKFAKMAQDASDFFSQLSALNVPLVGVDPSLVLCYRDEYHQVLGDNRGDFNIKLFQEWLTPQLGKVEKGLINNDKTHYQLFAHCSEKTAIASTHSDWIAIFQHLGLSLTSQEVGCCGMAGTYGHETKNLENSKALYAMSWQPKVGQHEQTQVLATGYSCRSQVKRLDGFKPLHPVQVIANALGEA